MSVIRLRRDLRGFFGYGGLIAPASLFFFLVGLSIGFLTSPHPIHWIWMAVTAITPLWWFSGRTVIKDGEPLSGVRWFPQRFELSEIATAKHGRLPWGRGSLVGGVMIVTSDGLEEGLRLSVALTEKRREKWIQAIVAELEANRHHRKSA